MHSKQCVPNKYLKKNITKRSSKKIFQLSTKLLHVLQMFPIIKKNPLILIFLDLRA